MKTYLEIVNEVVGSTIKIRPGESIPMSTAMAAAKRYASQAIDEAANMATTKIQVKYPEQIVDAVMTDGDTVIVDRASILKVKELLK